METIEFNEVLKDNISVLEELIGVVTPSSNGLMSKEDCILRGGVPSNSDLNNYIKPGRYSLNGGVNISNSPVSAPIYGTLLIVNGYSGGVMQILAEHGSNTIYYRLQTSQGFPHKWRRIAT